MKNQEENSNSRVIEIEHTKKDVEKLSKEGVPEDDLPEIGVKNFKRSKFVAKRNEQKIKISMYLDADILDYFKERARNANSAPYQTQINNELRVTMEADSIVETENSTDFINDEAFLKELKEKLATI